MEAWCHKVVVTLQVTWIVARGWSPPTLPHPRLLLLWTFLSTILCTPRSVPTHNVPSVLTEILFLHHSNMISSMLFKWIKCKTKRPFLDLTYYTYMYYSIKVTFYFFYRLQGFLTIMWLFFLQGCYDKLEEYIKQNGIIIGTAAIVTAVFMVNSHCNTNIPAFNTCINYQDWFLSLLKTYYIHPPN